MKRPRFRLVARRIAGSAPVLSIAALLLLPRIGMQSAATQDAIESRNAEVQTAINRVPYVIGDWVGEDVSVPLAAIELLHPNAILSRSYRHLDDGISASLLVVHCSDARDMGGHYPPICYPQAGWDGCSEPSETNATVDIDGRPITMRVYEFRRLDQWSSEQRLRVFNYFVLPDGETTVALADVRRQADRPTVSRLGVAQVQVVMAGTLPHDVSVRAARELVGGLSDLFNVLGQGDS